MAARPEFGPPDPDERAQLDDLLADRGATPDATAARRVEVVGRDSVRVLRGANGSLDAALTMLPMAQYFGGRHVPVMGLAGLAVRHGDRPDDDTAVRLLTSVLQQAREDGFAAACVQPQRQGRWRDAGFEQAGARFQVSMDTRDVRVADHDLQIQRIAASDMSAVVACYQRHAQALDGHFVRHPWCWHAIQNPPDTDNEVQTYLISGDKGVEGYVYMLQRDNPSGQGKILEVTDMAALTAAAGRRILTLFADNTSLTSTVQWHSSPSDGLCVLLPERTFSITIANYWFMRIIDLDAALTRRGYPRGVSGELHFDIEDNVLTGNAGRRVLRVLDGRGTVESGGRGTLRASARGFAALYTGHRPPSTLRAAGLLEGPDGELALAQTIFGGSDPWHPDLL